MEQNKLNNSGAANGYEISCLIVITVSWMRKLFPFVE